MSLNGYVIPVGGTVPRRLSFYLEIFSLENTMKYSITIIFLFCLLALGCNNKNPHGVIMVTGVVTFDDLPLEGATVTFSPQEGSLAAVGLTDEQGRFTLNSGSSKAGTGAQPGTYCVSVTKQKIEGKANKPDTGIMQPVDVNAGAMPRVVNLIPPQYGGPKTSGLQAVVEKGKKNHFTFDLKSK